MEVGPCFFYQRLPSANAWTLEPQHVWSDDSLIFSHIYLFKQIPAHISPQGLPVDTVCSSSAINCLAGLCKPFSLR